MSNIHTKNITEKKKRYSTYELFICQLIYNLKFECSWSVIGNGVVYIYIYIHMHQVDSVDHPVLYSIIQILLPLWCRFWDFITVVLRSAPCSRRLHCCLGLKAGRYTMHTIVIYRRLENDLHTRIYTTDVPEIPVSREMVCNKKNSPPVSVFFFIRPFIHFV